MFKYKIQHRLLELACALFLVLLPLPAFAIAAPNFPAGTVDTIASFLSLIIGGLYLVTWIVFDFMRTFLDPTTFFDLGGATTSLLEILNKVWRLARDLVNILFALVLVLGAIYTVVTAKKDLIMNYWAKFVMAVILVNFSWFFPMVTIDIANIAATTVYGIPSMLGTTMPPCKTISSINLAGMNCVEQPPKVFSCDCAYIEDIMFFLDETNYANKQAAGWECPLNQLMCYQKSVLDISTATPSAGILNGLIVNHANLQYLAEIPPPSDKTAIGQVLEFLMREGLLLLFLIILLLPLVAMLIAFIIRIPVLWITIAFMPFYFAKFVLPEKLTQGWPQKIMDNFLQAAFLPALVAIPLTVGFIMVNAGATYTVGLGNLSLQNLRLLSNVSTMFQLLWILMSMGVIWFGVFAILNNMKIIGMGSTAIKNYGQMLGGLVLKAPLALPFIPLPGGGPKLSPLAAMRMPQTLKSAIEAGAPLPEALERIKGGKGGEDFDSAARRIGANSEAMKSLGEKIERLGGAAKGTNAEKSALEEIKRYLSRDLQVDTSRIDTNNISSAAKALRELTDKLQQQSNASTAPGIGTMQRTLDKILQRSAAPAPAAPPPVAPPPPAPGGAPAA